MKEANRAKVRRAAIATGWISLLGVVCKVVFNRRKTRSGG